MAQFIGFGGLILVVMGTLFKINHDMCKNNDKEIKNTVERFHVLDKKLDILIAALEVKFPTIIDRAVVIVNGNDKKKNKINLE